MPSDIFELRADWGLRRESVEECAARLARMLDRLSDLHPGFRHLIVEPNWNAARPSGLLPRRAEDIVGFLDPVKIYGDGRKRRFEDGCRLDASGEWAKGRSVILGLCAGAHSEVQLDRGPINWISITLNTREDGGDDRVTLSALIPILHAMIAAWQPSRAGAFSTMYRRLWRRESDRWPYPWGSWALYLAPESAAKVQPPANAIVQHCGEGGLLLLATDEPFDTRNATHVAAVEAIHAAVTPWP